MDIPHICQKMDWDCGIACVEMVLRHNLGQNFKDGSLECLLNTLVLDYKDSCLWTIDLVNVLVNYNIDCVYHTITHGVDPGYKNQPFYRKCFGADEMRVNKLFENAEQLGLQIAKGSVTIEEISFKLNQGYIAIVLIDASKLQCNYCGPWNLESLYSDSYHGHYILLCGYESEQKLFIYKNPSTTIPQCFINISTFESAWHSYGTDDDIIFINLNKPRRKETDKL